MSNRFPAPCPVSKQILGGKSWHGYAGFNFPGFAGTWNCGASSGLSAGGGWADPPGGWTEGWSGGAPAAINPGDLVLSSLFPFTKNSVAYPQVYYVYECILGGATAGGRQVDPAMDSTSNAFDATDINAGAPNSGSQASTIPPSARYPDDTPSGSMDTYYYTAVIGQTYHYTLGGVGAPPPGGPSDPRTSGMQALSVNGLTAASGTFVATSTSIPIVAQNTYGYDLPAASASVNAQLSIPRHFQPWTGYGSSGLDGPTATPDTSTGGLSRILWLDGASSGVAYLNLSISTVFSGWPSAPSGYVSTVGHSFDNYVDLTDGTFTFSWAINPYTGAVTTGSSGSPDAYQTAWLFPVVPTAWWTQYGSAVIFSGIYYISPGYGGYPFSATCPLLSWNFTATELQFVWAAWLSGYAVGQALSTITQTLVLSGEYDRATSQSQALALLDGISWSALNWNQQAHCSYNSDGSIGVVIGSISSTAPADTTCSGAGLTGEMAGPTATAATGYAETAASAEDWAWTYAKALVDVCGKYCLRTFYCNRTPAVVDCASGTVDGYAPVEIGPPSFDESLGDEAVYTFLYPNCQCS